MAALTDLQISAIERKGWLGATDVAKLLGVSVSTVKNLWASGSLIYKVAANKQHTRKSSLAMIREYQNKLMTRNPFGKWKR